jgi:hypothetical protein
MPAILRMVRTAFQERLKRGVVNMQYTSNAPQYPVVVSGTFARI